jgi:hypothetical protein
MIGKTISHYRGSIGDDDQEEPQSSKFDRDPSPWARESSETTPSLLIVRGHAAGCCACRCCLRCARSEALSVRKGQVPVMLKSAARASIHRRGGKIPWRDVGLRGGFRLAGGPPEQSIHHDRKVYLRIKHDNESIIDKGGWRPCRNPDCPHGS